MQTLNSHNDTKRKPSNQYQTLANANSNKVQKLALTGKEKELLRFVGQNGVASLSQLHRKFWSVAKSITTARTHLSRLEKSGYLQCFWISLRRSSCFKPEQKREILVFILTRQGAGIFTQAERKTLITELPPKAEITQQLRAQEARLLLEQKLAAMGAILLEWHNERNLRRKAYRQKREREHAGIETNLEDARAIIRLANGTEQSLVLEIDGEYWGQMLTKKLVDFSKKGLQSQLLWWVTTANRVNRIRREMCQAGIENIQLLVIDEPGR